MSLTPELRRKYRDLWERMVGHPFVLELGEGTLPAEKFRTYFLQDYVFVGDLVNLVAQGVAKAPDFDAAARLNAFLSGVLNPESDLFERAFKEFGVSKADYESATPSPTTQAFGDFLVRIGLEGTFDDIVTVLFVTEGTYLDWATRLITAGKVPENSIYREWIEIHGPEVLGDLVDWMGNHLDSADLDDRRDRIERLYLTALRYEYMFWEAAHHGEDWPGAGV